MKLLLSLIGVVLVLEGLPYLAFPEAMRRWLSRMTTMDNSSLRIAGMVSVLLGLAICYLARKSGIFG
jgi:uncharacterized protein YjeT (DUF2065 family)